MLARTNRGAQLVRLGLQPRLHLGPPQQTRVTGLVRVKPGFQRGQQLVALFGDNFLVLALVFIAWAKAGKVNQFGERAASRATNSPERGSVTRSNFATQNAR